MKQKKKFWTSFIFLLRVFLGGVFLFTGYLKSQDIDGFITVIYKIQFIPYIIANILGIIIIILELSIGISLILGLYLTLILRITFIVLILFTIFLSAVLIFKLEIEGCGCFGNLSKKNISILDVFKNIILLIIATILFKKHEYGLFLSIDRYTYLKKRDN